MVRVDKKPKTATGCLKAKGSYKNDFQEDLNSRNPEDSGELRSYKKVQIIEDMDSKVCTLQNPSKTIDDSSHPAISPNPHYEPNTNFHSEEEALHRQSTNVSVRFRDPSKQNQTAN